MSTYATEIRKLTALALVQSASSEQQQQHSYVKIRYYPSNTRPTNIEISMYQVFNGMTYNCFSLSDIIHDKMYIYYRFTSSHPATAEFSHLEKVFGFTDANDICVYFESHTSDAYVFRGYITFIRNGTCTFSQSRMYGSMIFVVDFNTTAKSLLKLHTERPIRIDRKIEFFPQE
jgi:hypothetical protein